MRWSRVLAVVACAAILTTAVAYGLLLQQQDSGPDAATTAWTAFRGAPTWVLATLAAAMATTFSASWLRPSRGRRRLLIGTAIVLFAVGFVAIFSIGLGLFLGGALSLAAAATDKVARGPSTPTLPAPAAF